MKLTPLADRVIVKPIDEPETKKGGIIIPDTAKEKPQQGEIIAVGPGRRDGYKLPLRIAKGRELSAKDAAGVDVDGAVEPLGLPGQAQTEPDGLVFHTPGI